MNLQEYLATLSDLRIVIARRKRELDDKRAIYDKLLAAERDAKAL